MTDSDWSKPAAKAIPKEGYFELSQGRFGPVFPRTPACYGFTVIAKVKPGKEQVVREYGISIEQAVAADPGVLAPLKLHYLRWVLFDVGSGLHFMYQGIFDTDFDKYLEDAIALFNATGIDTVFLNLEGWPEDWRTNLQAVSKFFRDHQRPSFLDAGQWGMLRVLDRGNKAILPLEPQPPATERAEEQAPPVATPAVSKADVVQ